VLAEQVAVLRNVAVIKVGKPEIQENVEQQRKVEDHRIFAIIHVADLALHFWLYNNGPEGFD
jgi:hypothetical protein